MNDAAFCPLKKEEKHIPHLTSCRAKKKRHLVVGMFVALILAVPSAIAKKLPDNENSLSLSVSRIRTDTAIALNVKESNLHITRVRRDDNKVSYRAATSNKSLYKCTITPSKNFSGVNHVHCQPMRG